MSNRLVRKLVQEMKLSIGPLAKLVRFCARKKNQCVHFQPSPNQFKRKADSADSSPVAYELQDRIHLQARGVMGTQ